MSNDYSIERLLDSAVTIGNEESPDGEYGNGRSVTASVRGKDGEITDAGISLRLYQLEERYASESADIHLGSESEEPLKIAVQTHKPLGGRSSNPWATLELGRNWYGTVEDGNYPWHRTRRTRSSTVFIAASELVEVRNELTKAIRKARRDGHIA